MTKEDIQWVEEFFEAYAQDIDDKTIDFLITYVAKKRALKIAADFHFDDQV